MRFIKVHPIIKRIFYNQIWEIPTQEKKIFLTFDDGPTPKITRWTLDLLNSYDAKATFFCVGNNVANYPEIVKETQEQGHSIGNHTFNHWNGWKYKTTNYLQNVITCGNVIKKVLPEYDLHLFRPPYGKIKLSQANAIRDLGYKIIMWSLVSYDFDTSLSKEECLQNVLKNCKPGSVIVFHDSEKAFKNLEYVLPKTLEFLKQNNFKMEVLT